MKKIFFTTIFLLLSSLALNAQEKKIAIFEPEGEVENYIKNLVRDEIIFSLKKSTEYEILNQTELQQLLIENNFNSEMLLFESRLSELGKKMGVDLILITNVSLFGKNNYSISGRLVNVSKAIVEKQTSEQTQNGMGGLEKAIQSYANNFQYQAISSFASEKRAKEEQEYAARYAQEKAQREADERACVEQKAQREAEERAFAEEKTRKEAEERALAEKQANELAQKEAEEREFAENQAREKERFEAIERALAAQKARELKQEKCETLFNNGKKAHDDANNSTDYQDALNIFQEGFELGCNNDEFSYWLNICKTKIEYLNATLNVAPTTLEFESFTGSKNITVNSSYSAWDIEPLPQTANSWLSGKKTDQQSLTITCRVNNLLQERKGTVTVKAGNKTEQITITQKGKRYLLPEVLRLVYSNLNANATVFSKSNIKHKGEKTSSGQRNGFGVQLWPDGNLFFGRIVNGECTNGMFIDGDITISLQRHANKFQVGNFSGLQLNGEAKCYDESGTMTYQGEFFNDSPWGSTYWLDNRYPNLRFEIFETTSGYYMGETKDGVRHGKGVYILRTGEMWYGDWLNDTKFYGIDIKMDGTFNLGSDFDE